MPKRKKWGERILYAAGKERVINERVLRRRLRIPKTEMDSRKFHNTVMRVVRLAAEEQNGLLVRTRAGEYRITRYGRSMLETHIACKRFEMWFNSLNIAL
jgi:hypothetical protein